MSVNPVSAVVLLLALAVCTYIYDRLIIDWMESRPGGLPAKTAWEVVAGVMIVLVFYLLMVGGRTLTGTESFVLILCCFVAGGTPMVVGSYRRAERILS